MSYYWQWHQPLLLNEIEDKLVALKSNYDKDVLIVETGYHWTTANNDAANNILTESHPGYSDISPETQKQFLIDLSEVLHSAGAMGLIYWEPAWQSSPCYTPWGQGSHLENASFFDFNNELLLPGGIEWMQYDYVTSTKNDIQPEQQTLIKCKAESIEILMEQKANLSLSIYQAVTRKKLKTYQIDESQRTLPFNFRANQLYFVVLYQGNRVLDKTGYLFFN